MAELRPSIDRFRAFPGIAGGLVVEIPNEWFKQNMARCGFRDDWATMKMVGRIVRLPGACIAWPLREDIRTPLVMHESYAKRLFALIAPGRVEILREGC